jgi:hypothetical protein
MVLILPAFLIIVVALVLAHLRKQRLMTEYVDLATKGLERDASIVREVVRPLRELVLTQSLRHGILYSVVGATVLGISLLDRMDLDPLPHSFPLALGLVIAAFGCGHLIVWLVVDRPRMLE